MARKRIFRRRAAKSQSGRFLRKWKLRWRKLPVHNGWLALILLNLAVLISGLESAYVQAVTTYQAISLELFVTPSFIYLLCLDLLFPLIVALLSRRAFFVFLAGQCFLSTILLHYTIFFYNPLTLSTIFHSMQGAASLGIDIFGFARPDIIAACGALLALKVLLVQLSRAPERRMPRFWHLRGITAVSAMAVVFALSTIIYGKTGLSLIWVDSIGHRTASERRLDGGTTEAVRNIGYLATWIGEWMSGTYKDTELIYAERRCADPDATWSPDAAWSAEKIADAGLLYGTSQPGGAQGDSCKSESVMTQTSPTALQAVDTIASPSHQPEKTGWNGLPLPPIGNTVVLLQVESLDFAALGMKVNGHPVLPFIDFLTQDSLLLRVFAPHKVGSSNSDYELLNGRIAEQNVIYYSYITEYPDSIIHLLAGSGYETSVFHGLGGNLFNLREAYRSQGFEHLYFKEELLEAGYKPGKYIMEHILDEDVFSMAAAKLRADSAPRSFPVPAAESTESQLSASTAGNAGGGMDSPDANRAAVAQAARNHIPASPSMSAHGIKVTTPTEGKEAATPGKRAQFIVTMSSHIPFMSPNPLFKSAGGSFSRYVSSLRYLDQCLAAYYSMLPEGTLLIIWGDHGSDVAYPEGLPQNSRHVPFMIHVKGDTGWFGGKNKEARVATRTGMTDMTGMTGTNDTSIESIESVKNTHQNGYPYSLTGKPRQFPLRSQASPLLQAPLLTQLDCDREYRLCELHYYLRRIFE
ncbi:sulfatase-like hydrolase/transferase [Desulfovibrio sp. OttesenSCG-928-C06]|nr:sulfatase-like hydrolase/transferase [Desulfovibrio sp. OttesenSCG-928-C06]